MISNIKSIYGIVSMEDSAVQQAAHLLSWTGHHKLWQDFVQANSCTETPRNFRAQGLCKGVVPFSHQSCSGFPGTRM